MNNRRLTIVKNEKKQVLLIPFAAVTFLRQRKKGTGRKDLSFFHQQRKQGNIETLKQCKSSEQKTGGKKEYSDPMRAKQDCIF